LDNKVFCSAFGISTVCNKIWCSAYDFNEIYEIDILSHKMRSLGQLEGEDNTCHLVESIECCLDTVLFVPGYNGKYFHVLDINTGKQTKFLKTKFFDEIGPNHINRFLSFIWNNKAYIVCRDELSVYCYNLKKKDFEMVFDYDKKNSFKCMAFSVWKDFVAFLSIRLNEIVLYDLSKNTMKQIKLTREMTGVNRIAITEDRIFLYRVEDRKVYLLDKKGTLKKEFLISTQTGNRIMMFPARESVYLVAITDWEKEVFKIDTNGNVENLHLNNMDDLNVYFLNRIDDDLYAYEFVARTKNIVSLCYNVGKCYKYKIGTNAVELIEWSTDEVKYENKIINMLKEGICLFENDVYNLEFMFKHINVQKDKENSENINVGENIFCRV